MRQIIASKGLLHIQTCLSSVLGANYETAFFFCLLVCPFRHLIFVNFEGAFCRSEYPARSLSAVRERERERERVRKKLKIQYFENIELYFNLFLNTVE